MQVTKKIKIYHMKKTLLFASTVFLFSIFYSNSFSQSFAFGYRAGAITSSGLDFIIDRYNSTRTAILTKNMDKINSLSGYVYSVGVNVGAGLEFQVPNLKSNTVTAESSSQIREVYMKLTGVEIILSVSKPAFEGNDLTGYIGGFLSIEKLDPTVYTRVYDKGSSSIPAYTSISNSGSVNVGIGPLLSAHYRLPSFTIFGEVRPFYSLALSGSDFYYTNIALNPSTWYNDDVDSPKGGVNYIGVTAKLGVTVSLF